MSASRDQRRHLYEQLVGTDVAGGRYTITALLGFGGMGAVYEAIQQNMNRKVALKLIPTHDPTIVARFEREAMTISNLHHPNTVTVFDYGQGDDGFLFLAMELLDGRTLSDAIKQGPMSPQQAVHITSQICRSLGEAHRAGIVHRDIKPDNIILIRVDQDHDFVKVLDFGIAKAVMGEDDVQLTGDGRIIGTPRYMSPEQILAEDLDHRSDIYSLGCILYEMLCGAPPFEQSSTTALMISHTQDPPPTFSQRLDPSKYSMMPGALEQVVRKGLAKSPSNRHQTTDEMREELQAAIEGRLAPAPFIDADSTAAAIPSSMAPSTGSQPVPVHITQSSELAQPETKRINPIVFAIIGLLFIIGGLVAYDSLTGDPADSDAGAIGQPETPNLGRIEPSTEVPVDEPAAQPGYVNLKISGTPLGAQVRDGDKVLGKTPLTYPMKRDREIVSLVITKDGFHDNQIGVPLQGKQESRSIEYELEETRKSKAVKKWVEKKRKTPPKPKVERKIEEKVEPKKEEEKEPEREEGKTEVKLIDDTSDTKILRLD